MNNRILMIIAPKLFQDDEYNIPKRVFYEAGFIVDTASEHDEMCYGKFGTIVYVKIPLRKVMVPAYDAIVFVGGPGAVVYQFSTVIWRIIKDALKAHKVVGAICIAPTILAFAGILKGRQATVWNGDRQQFDLLRRKGATPVNKDVVVDGNVVTANGPKAAKKFAQAIVKKLKR